jgi:hypothetical protein
MAAKLRVDLHQLTQRERRKKARRAAQLILEASWWQEEAPDARGLSLSPSPSRTPS